MSLVLKPMQNLTMSFIHRDQLPQFAMGGRYNRLVYNWPVALDAGNLFTLEKSVYYSLRTDDKPCREEEK